MRWLRPLVFILSIWFVSGCSDDEKVVAPAETCRSSEISNPDVLPVRTMAVTPVYPLEARVNGLEGDVFISVWIDPDSLICDYEFTDTPECDCFEEVVDRALWQSEFTAAQKDGVPVVGRLDLVYRFRLEGK